MQQVSLSPPWRYAVALAGVALATLVGVWLQPLLGDALPFALLVLAVLLSAWLGGIRPATVAIVLGTVAAIRFFLPPEQGWGVDGLLHQAGLALFILVSCAVAAVAGLMRSTHKQTELAVLASHQRQAELEREIAEHQRTEDSLRDSEARLRLALEAGRMGTWEWTVGANKVVWSPGLEALHGLAPGTFGGTFADYLSDVHPEDRDYVQGSIAKTLEGGAEHHVEYRLVWPDGSVHWVEGRGKLFQDAHGQPQRMVGVCIDISQRKRVEEILARSEEQFRQAIVGAPIPIVMHAEDGEILQLSDTWLRLSGYSREEIPTFADWLKKAYGDHAAEVATSVQQIFDGRQATGEAELVITTRSGERRMWHFTASAPGKLHDGRRFLVSMATDVTERKQNEQASKFLADASAAISELVDYESTLQRVAWLAVPFFADWCSVDMLDAQGNLRRLAVAHVDPAKVELAHVMHREYPADPAASRGVWAMLRNGHSELIEHIPDEMLVESARDERLLQLLRDLGLRSYLGVPLIVRGKPVGVLTFIAAESGRRYTQSDLALAEDLARRAAIAIENCQLYAEVRDTDRRKDVFLATLAHELRNPLAPIRSSVEVMRLRGIDDPELQWARDVIGRQVDQMTRLVDDLLDISRISRGKIQLHKEPVDLTQIVNRALETTRPLIDARQHQLIVTLPATPVRVDADPTRLEQMLSNLLNNAAKYTEPAGEICLAADVQGSEVEIRVRDTGIGMSATMLPRIFDMFVQAEDGNPRAGGGLGIGLSLVRSLAQLHGGSISAHSPGPGQGSEFIVRLPVLPNPVIESAPSNPQRAQTGPRRRILVVDDNVDAALSLAMLLRLQGQEVELAHDGLQALAAIENNPPELVFLDIGLPDMSGHDVARKIRQGLGKRRMTIVALTGWGQDDDRRRSREAGFDQHLTKPVDMATLQSLLTAAGDGQPV